jgi:hypothetical protein
MIVKESKIVSATSAADLTGKEGWFVEGTLAAATIVNAVTDNPYGVITVGELAAGRSSVALMGYAGTVKVKVDATPGTIVFGTQLKITATGTVTQYAGTGAAVVVAVALESGAANELIEAVLLDKPMAIGNAVTVGNTNSEISGLTFSSTVAQGECEALRDKCEELGDDVRAIYAALQAAKLLA